MTFLRCRKLSVTGALRVETDGEGLTICARGSELDLKGNIWEYFLYQKDDPGCREENGIEAQSQAILGKSVVYYGVSLGYLTFDTLDSSLELANSNIATSQGCYKDQE